MQLPKGLIVCAAAGVAFGSFTPFLRATVLYEPVVTVLGDSGSTARSGNGATTSIRVYGYNIIM